MSKKDFFKETLGMSFEDFKKEEVFSNHAD